jgi:dTDP-4-dehydrorhamnose reductase
MIRTSAFFGPWDQYNFVTVALNALRTTGHFVAMNDAWISPTYVPDLVNTTLDLLIDGEQGLWHLANDGDLTWADFARRAAAKAGFDAETIEGRPTASFSLPATRPLYCVLKSSRGALMRSVDAALDAYFEDCEAARVAPASVWPRKIAVQALAPWNRAQLLSQHLHAKNG